MHRRELLQLLGSAAAVPALTGLSPGRLLALGGAAHRRLPGRPLATLDARQAETVATIAELIIPETDTPGARAAAVHEFIDLILTEWYDPEERERFMEGLAGVDARGRTAFGAEFLDLPEARQAAILRELDAEVAALREAGEREADARGREADVTGREAAPPEAAEQPPEAAAAETPVEKAEESEEEAAARKPEPEARTWLRPSDEPGDHFFDQMKWLTLYGYYTSKIGVEEELEYVIVPGHFDPCSATGLRSETGG